MKGKLKKKLMKNGKEKKQRGIIRRILFWIGDHIDTILYVLMLIVLWTYIIYNWDACISMQFFSQFDGNNILFIVGIVLIILPFYDIEGKGIKLRRKSAKDMKQDFQSADSVFYQKKIKNEFSALQSEISAKSDGGEYER